MSSIDPALVSYLDVLHRARSYRGFEDFYDEHRDLLPDDSTLYRWHRKLGERLVFFPNIATSALGLVHQHVFIEGARDLWLSYRYAISGAWLVGSVGRETLYLHCLVPHDQLARASNGIARLEEQTGNRATWFITSEGWQYFNPRLLDPSYRAHGDLRSDEPMPVLPINDVVRSCPLLVPVFFESFECRRSLREVAQRIVQRGLWQYVPRQRRRNPVRHVAVAQARLGKDLFRQNVIRLAPLLDECIEVVLVARLRDPSIIAEWIERLRTSAPTVEVFTGRDGACVLRVLGDLRMLQELLHLPTREHVQLYYLDHELGRLNYSYENFDPITCAWVER